MQSGTDSLIPFRHRLTVRLTAGVILALLLIGVPFLFAFHNLRRAQQLADLEQWTGSLSRVVVDGLRASMLADRPHLLDEVVRDLSGQPEVQRVMLLDRSGRVAVASDEESEGRVFDRRSDEVCKTCHRADGSPPPDHTVIITGEAGAVFRAMTTVPNGPECHGCHDASAPTNGVLLMDLSMKTADIRFLSGIGSSAALGGVMLLLTILVLALLLRRVVHRPLGAVVDTSRRIVGGDLDARVPVPPSGEFSLLATQVNNMTNHLARSLQDVESHHRELQAVLDSVDDEIVVLDRQRRVVVANQAFRKGVPSREDDQIDEVFNTGRLQKKIVSRPSADGEERAVEIHASPVLGADGTVSQVVEVRRDITERRQLEATLAQSERLASLGLLASGISHEINNPLAAIATTVEGLRRRISSADDPNAIAEHLETSLARVARDVQRGREITHRLLRVARPPSGSRGLVDVNHAIRDIVAVLSHQIKSQGITIRLDLAEKLPPLRGDESRLSQVLMNLTLNAIQAMTRGQGLLRIGSSVENGDVKLVVQDTGQGIPQSAMGRIYEPFFTTKPVGQGTGLGLFITHRLVTEMSGTIQVQTRPGRGTAFTIHLPVAGGGETIQ